MPLVPPHFEAPSYALDEPIVVVHGRGDGARGGCMAAEAVRADGLRAVERLHWPEGTHFAPTATGPTTLLQDHVAIPAPGTWKVRFRAGCEDTDPWTDLVVEVRPAKGVALDALLAHPTVAALPGNLVPLRERAAAGDVRAARALAAIPTPEATDVLDALREDRTLAEDVQEVVHIEWLVRQPDETRPWALAWSAATWTAAHSRAAGLEPDHDPGVRAISVLDPGPQPLRFALDAPIFVDSEVEAGARRIPCFEVRATGPGGEALVRPDRPHVPRMGNQQWGPGKRVVLQDFVAIDRPGLWEVRIASPPESCHPTVDPDAWKTFRVRVDPPTLDRSDWDPHPYYASPVALPAYLADLEKLADQGLEWAVRAIGGIPDTASTDALIRLLDHPRSDVSGAAALALSYRMPPHQPRPELERWSERTWRPEHDGPIGAWLDETTPSGPLWEAWSGGMKLVDAKREAAAGSARGWHVLWFHHHMGRPLTLSAEDLRFLGLMEARHRGEPVADAAIVAALDRPATRHVAPSLVTTCTPELAARLRVHAHAGELKPYQLEVCPPLDFVPDPESEVDARIVSWLTAYAVDHLVEQPALRSVLVRLSGGGTVTCPATPDAAEVERWKAALHAPPSWGVSAAQLPGILPDCEIRP